MIAAPCLDRWIDDREMGVRVHRNLCVWYTTYHTKSQLLLCLLFQMEFLESCPWGKKLPSSLIVFSAQESPVVSWVAAIGPRNEGTSLRRFTTQGIYRVPAPPDNIWNQAMELFYLVWSFSGTLPACQNQSLSVSMFALLGALRHHTTQLSVEP